MKMKYLKNWNEFLNEETTKKTEIRHKREEIQNKISQIEKELDSVNVKEQTPEMVETKMEFEIQLESLKKELKNYEIY